MYAEKGWARIARIGLGAEMARRVARCVLIYLCVYRFLYTCIYVCMYCDYRYTYCVDENRNTYTAWRRFLVPHHLLARLEALPSRCDVARTVRPAKV